MATGTVTWTYDEGHDGLGQHCNLKRVVFAWTSTSGGAAADTSRKIVGKIVKAITVPGTGGSAPTNNYSITITDPNSINVLAGAKANLSANSGSANAETYFFIVDTSGTPVTQAMSPVVCDALTITVGSAGNAKSGTLILYYEPL